MARLIVDAVSQESKSIHDDSYVSLLFVSVSHADAGQVSCRVSATRRSGCRAKR